MCYAGGVLSVQACILLQLKRVAFQTIVDTVVNVNGHNKSCGLNMHHTLRT